jgi:DNA-3-methyladenine glycosylase II
MAPRKLVEAAAEIAARDPALANVIEQAGPPTLTRSRRTEAGLFAELAESIAYQQLAGAAAAAIWGRFRALVEGELTPESVLALREEAIRGAGMSGAKTAALKDLAAKVHDGTVPLADVHRVPDDELIARLSSVRGIGRWTAEMFLIFTLARLDVWPVDDLGVRRGYQLAHGLAEMPKPKALQAMGEPYRPYRTIAAWYCWQAARLARGQALR